VHLNNFWDLRTGRYSIVKFFFQCKTVAGAKRNGSNHVLSNEDSGTFVVLCNPYSEGSKTENSPQEERETIL
jgi:hypothetical protein